MLENLLLGRGIYRGCQGGNIYQEQEQTVGLYEYKKRRPLSYVLALANNKTMRWAVLGVQADSFVSRKG